MYKKANDLGTNTRIVNKKTDNPGIFRIDKNRKVDNLDTDIDITNTDWQAKNPGISISTTNKKADNLDIGTTGIDRAKKPGTEIDKRVNRQITTKNKAHIFLFFWIKSLLYFDFFSELTTVFASLYLFLLSPIILIKQKLSYSRYFLTKM